MRNARYVALLGVAFLAGSMAGCSTAATQLTVPQGRSNFKISASNAAPQFHAIRLPVGFLPSAMMDDGQIPGSLGKDAAVYRNGKVTVLGEYKDWRTIATSINSKGVAVGYAATRFGGWQPLEFNGGVEPLFKISGCEQGDTPTAIGEGGQIYGICGNRAASNDYVARFDTEPPLVILLSNGEQMSGMPYNVNSRGEFSASYCDVVLASCRAYRGHGIYVYALPFNPRNWTTATWVNDSGVVVGGASNSSQSSPTLAYQYQNGTVNYLPLLPGISSMAATGINKYGEIIGSADGTVFLYENGQEYNLSNSISPSGRYSPGRGFSDSESFVASDPNHNYYVIQPFLQASAVGSDPTLP